MLRLVEQADALIEGYRPGVTERLGLGPDVCLARNPKLVYGRMTGWGQDGPMAQAAGHDINYIALAGALAHFGRAGGKPTPPINLVGDFGGGGMFMAFGIVCGILEAQRSGKGQVLDVAMVDGSAILMSMMWGLKQIGFWDEAMGANVLDTGAPFYDTYETADGKFISLGSLEPQFYAELIQRLGLESEGLPAQMDQSGWDTLRDALHRAVQDQDARRVGRDPRRERRLLRAGAHDVGGDEQRAHQGAQHDHRARRRAAAGARAALLAHRRRGAAVGAVARPAHRRGARRLGRRRGRGRQAARDRRDRLIGGALRAAPRAARGARRSRRRGAVASVIVPPCNCAICSTMARPSPDPGSVRAVVAR